jgi:hypothetical protein
MMPQYWRDFIEANRIVRKSFHLSESDDESGSGADLTILTAEQSLDEATRYWPGIGVARDGYVPVAWCDGGSGDWFYINSNDGINGPLYRIYHDSVSANGYEPSDAIAVVLQNYEKLLSCGANDLT